MEIKFIKDFILNESKDHENKIFRTKLTYALSDLSPIISEDTMDYHYGKLYKAYVDRYNTGEGDADFNEAGAFLHKIYFEQFKEPSSNGKLESDTEKLIEEHFSTLKNFKDMFQEEAMKIQGSGWVYLSRNGQIKTIKNHSIKKDILLLIDFWEHAWALDYQADKKKYLNNIWKIIDWNVINQRIISGVNK